MTSTHLPDQIAEKIAELEGLLERATKGPWKALHDRRRASPWRIEDVAGDVWIADLPQILRGECPPEIAANAQLIVAAINSLPTLISALKSQQRPASLSSLSSDQQQRPVEEVSEEQLERGAKAFKDNKSFGLSDKAAMRAALAAMKEGG